MTKEEKLLLDILRAYLEQNSINIPQDTDYNRLLSLSKAHNLAAIVFSVIKKEYRHQIPKEVYTGFEDAFYESISRYDIQESTMQVLKDILTENNIVHAFFKGAQIKEYFPVPELRTMGDIDVLIDKQKRDEVKKLLNSKGFEQLSENGAVYNYRYNSVLIEAHTNIMSDKIGKVDFSKYFCNATEHIVQNNNGTYCLDADYHFEYMLAHIAHHFWFFGAGAKLILDLAVMQKQFNIDTDKIVDNLGSIGLENFSKIILTVCFKWFGVGKDYGKDTKQTEEFLLNYGAFGNANRNKSVVVQRKALEQGKKSTFATKLALAFPSYEKLKNIPYIHFIEDKPYLTPIAWVYRIGYNIKHRRNFLKQSLEGIGNSATYDMADKELKFFEEIGLL